jgi:hypothetical protein
VKQSPSWKLIPAQLIKKLSEDGCLLGCNAVQSGRSLQRFRGPCCLHHQGDPFFDLEGSLPCSQSEINLIHISTRCLRPVLNIILKFSSRVNVNLLQFKTYHNTLIVYFYVINRLIRLIAFWFPVIQKNRTEIKKKHVSIYVRKSINCQLETPLHFLWLYDLHTVSHIDRVSCFASAHSGGTFGRSSRQVKFASRSRCLENTSLFFCILRASI